ncbi:MAG: HNH endonuclease [Thiothrix sp.]|nr:MAG: HNH endonuclease [Thiothrix sp.]
MSIQTALSGISFDEQDANLFLVEDARLRADALKYSVLPRLRKVMNVAISLIRDIYGIEVLDDSIVSVYPNFRQQRDHELSLKYTQVFVGLGGQRKAKWPGFSRKDAKPVQVLPFRFAFLLDKNGIFTALENGWLKGLDKQSSEMLLRFHIDNEHKINPLCFISHMQPALCWSDELLLLAPFRDQYELRLYQQLYDNHFLGHNYHFPVSELTLAEVVTNFVCFFPVYDSYIQIAKGLPHRLDVLTAKLSSWLQSDRDEVEEKVSSSDDDSIKSYAVEAAAAKIRVMPALRWQVFQRDQWKCVACGRSSHDGTILHVDHILPRSRGGLDLLENFQTLCDVCNIGKSNKDVTNLRSKG